MSRPCETKPKHARVGHPRAHYFARVLKNPLTAPNAIRSASVKLGTDNSTTHCASRPSLFGIPSTSIFSTPVGVVRAEKITTLSGSFTVLSLSGFAI